MREIKLNTIYRHFKGDNYLVIDIVIDSETNKEMVLYKGLYGNLPCYVRPLDMFLSEVDHDKYPEVEQKYRFEEITIDSVKKILKK